MNLTVAEPRWATPRTPGRKTLGGAINKMSAILGQPLMPWQRDCADVAYELNDEGQFAYDTIVVTVMRQQGKTTLVRAVNLTRPMIAMRQTAIYTAQSALDARKKWVADWIPAVQNSPLGSQVKTDMSPGRETMMFGPTGSRLGIVATTEQAGHGDVIDQGTIDEAFALEDARVEQSMRPAMMTRWSLERGDLGAQLWIPSTAGRLGRKKGQYLRDYVTRGRQAVDSGRSEGLCYIEYSAPDDADPSDPQTWRGCMPALGRTVSEKVVASAQQSMKASEFARAFLNQWVLDGDATVMPVEQWQRLSRPNAPRPEWVVLGLDVGQYDSAASVAAVGEMLDTDQGAPRLQGSILDSGTGIDWLLGDHGALQRHVDMFNRPYVIVDEKACQHLLPEIERVVGFDRVIVRKASEVPRACSFWLRVATQGLVYHRGESELTAAIVGAGQRTLLDGWAWSRAKSGVDITPLVAFTLACSFWLGAWHQEED
jgi:hypothetical protein